MSKKKITPESPLDALDDFSDKYFKPSEINPWSPEAKAKEKAGLLAIEMFVAAFKPKRTPTTPS